MAGFFNALGLAATAGSQYAQGQEAAGLAKQQIQARQLEQEINNAIALGKLQDLASQRQALQSLPPAEQQFLMLPGGSVENWQKRQDMVSQAGAAADEAYQRALDPHLPVDQRLQWATFSANLRAHPELVGQLRNLTPAFPKPVVPHPFRSGTSLYAFEGDVDTSGRPIPTALGLPSATRTAGERSLKLVTTRDATGRTIQVWYDPLTGLPAPGRAPIPGKLTTTDLAAIEATNALLIDIPKLQAAAEKIGSGNTLTLANEYRKYGHPAFGIFGTVDPDYQDYFAQIGNVKSELAKLQSAGSSRSFQLLKFIQDHIPSETDPPAQAVGKLRTLEKGRFDSLTKAILGDSGVSEVPSSPAVDTMSKVVGRPVYDSSGRVVGFVK